MRISMTFSHQGGAGGNRYICFFVRWGYTIHNPVKEEVGFTSGRVVDVALLESLLSGIDLILDMYWYIFVTGTMISEQRCYAIKTEN